MINLSEKEAGVGWRQNEKRMSTYEPREEGGGAGGCLSYEDMPAS